MDSLQLISRNLHQLWRKCSQPKKLKKINIPIMTWNARNLSKNFSPNSTENNNKCFILISKTVWFTRKKLNEAEFCDFCFSLRLLSLFFDTMLSIFQYLMYFIWKRRWSYVYEKLSLNAIAYCQRFWCKQVMGK